MLIRGCLTPKPNLNPNPNLDPNCEGVATEGDIRENRCQNYGDQGEGVEEEAAAAEEEGEGDEGDNINQVAQSPKDDIAQSPKDDICEYERQRLKRVALP